MDTYQVVVSGNIQEVWDDRFEGWTITHTDEGMTIFSGTTRDQAELYGILTAFRNMGLELVRVEKIRPVA